MHGIRGAVRILTGFDIWSADKHEEIRLHRNFNSSIANIQYINGSIT
jgi:hypothetical protein